MDEDKRKGTRPATQQRSLGTMQKLGAGHTQKPEGATSQTGAEAGDGKIPKKPRVPTQRREEYTLESKDPNITMVYFSHIQKYLPIPKEAINDYLSKKIPSLLEFPGSTLTKYLPSNIAKKKQLPKKIPQQLSQKIPQQAPQHLPQKISQQVSQQSPQQVSQQIPHQVSSRRTDQMSS